MFGYSGFVTTDYGTVKFLCTALTLKWGGGGGYLP